VGADLGRRANHGIHRLVPGTADAVRKQLFEIKSTNADYVLILAGTHLYAWITASMFDFHLDRNADVTVAVQPASREDAPRLGF
jgi:glucose-1-phosphate adenylyltransferase